MSRPVLLAPSNFLIFGSQMQQADKDIRGLDWRIYLESDIAFERWSERIGNDLLHISTRITRCETERGARQILDN